MKDRHENSALSVGLLKLASVLLLVTGITAASASQTDRLKRELEEYQSALSGRIAWMVLWDSLPDKFQTPRNQLANVSLGIASDSLVYCSSDLNVCGRYEAADGKLMRRAQSKEMPLGQTSSVAVFDYMVELGLVTKLSQNGTAPVLEEAVRTNSGVFWTATVRVPTRAELVRKYKALKPALLPALREELVTHMSNTDILSVTVACFDEYDEMIYFYADEKDVDFVSGTFWKEHGGWGKGLVVSASQPTGRAFVETMRRKIEEIPCLKIEFR